MKKMLIGVLMMTSSFLNGLPVPPDFESVATEEDKIVQQVLNQAQTILEKKFNMTAIGDVVGMPGNVLELIGLSFNIYHTLSKEEIRKMIVESVEEFLQIVNGNEKLRPFMEKYPFNVNNIEIDVFIYSSKKLDRIPHPDIGIAGCRKGKIEYITYKPKDEFGYESVVKEPYEEAVKIVRESSPQK